MNKTNAAAGGQQWLTAQCAELSLGSSGGGDRGWLSFGFFTFRSLGAKVSLDLTNYSFHPFLHRRQIKWLKIERRGSGIQELDGVWSGLRRLDHKHPRYRTAFVGKELSSAIIAVLRLLASPARLVWPRSSPRLNWPGSNSSCSSSAGAMVCLGGQCSPWISSARSIGARHFDDCHTAAMVSQKPLDVRHLLKHVMSHQVMVSWTRQKWRRRRRRHALEKRVEMVKKKRGKRYCGS